MVRSCVAKEEGWLDPVEPETDMRQSKSQRKSKNDNIAQEKPKIYSRQNRVSSETSQEWGNNHGTAGDSNRGNGSVGGGVYKSSRSLGLRPMTAQPAAAEATERHTTVPRRPGTDLEQDGSESPDAYDKADKETGNEPEPDMAWPNTQVDVEVPPLPSRVPPFLR